MDDAAAAAIMYGTTTTAPRSAPQTQEAEQAERLFGSTKPAAPSRQAHDPVARLYGGPDTAPVEDEPHTPHTEEEMQEILYPEPEEPGPTVSLPREVRDLRDSPDRRLFSAQDTYKEAAPDPSAEDCAEHGVDPEAVARGMVEVREILADLDLTPMDVRSLRSRAEALRRSPVAPSAQREAAVDALNRNFQQGAKQALRDARALVARDPRVGKMIEAMGLGDDAETIVMLAKQARSQRAAGKLKTRI